MKYLCLVYLEPGALDRLSPAERERLDRDSRAYDEELMAAGAFLAASALQSVRTGFIFIEAADMAAAEAVAEAIPMARYGTIEVRPELVF